MRNRDVTLDRLRGLAMLWVIVVHVLYWGNFLRNDCINILKSFCLFEMPLFFFVTGAGNSFSSSDDYFKFVYKRFKRLLIPYWVFALFCAALSVVYFAITETMDVATAINILLSWLIPVNRQITSVPYLTWALWFIPVYLCVVLILPILKALKASKYAGAALFALAGVFVATCLADLGWVQNVVFYSLWTYIGLFYNDILPLLERNKFRISIGLTALTGAISLAILSVLGQPLDMQGNKFPPNIMFGIFSVVMMCLIVLNIPLINKVYRPIDACKPAKRIADLYAKRSMTIFLYQVFAFNLTIPLANLLIPGEHIIAGVIKSVLCLIATVPICAALALVLGGIEDLGTKPLRSHKNQRD